MTLTPVLPWLVITAVFGLGAYALAMARRAPDRGPGRLVGALVAALLGSWAAASLFGEYSHWGPALSGLHVLPALVGALVVVTLREAAAGKGGQGHPTKSATSWGPRQARAGWAEGRARPA